MNITNVRTQTAAVQTQDSYPKSKFEKGDHVDISGLMDDAVALDISAEGLKKMDKLLLSEDRDISKEIHSAGANKSIDHLIPEYSGIAKADQAIHDALNNADDDTKAFVYRTIRNNFLVKDAADMTEEERQANISLGMEKAKYAANNMIDEGKRKDFLDAMESIAKLASAGTIEADGTMDYGITSKTSVQPDGKLIQSDDTLAVMRKLDRGAYAEYQNLQGNPEAQLRYFVNWHIDHLPVISDYASEQNEKNEEAVKNAQVDKTFEGAGNSTKEAFISFLQQFTKKKPDFLGTVIKREQLTWAK